MPFLIRVLTHRLLSLSLLLLSISGPQAHCQVSLPVPTEKLPSQAETAMPRRRGDITVKVADYEAARERILQALAIQGAELVEAKTLVNEKGRKHGWVTVRLDADRLPDALPVVRAAGKLYEENVTTSDDTSEYQTLARRADGLQKHQGRLAGILSSERRLRGSDILYVQERLFRASVDEGLLLQQRKDIERGSRTCTVTIRLFEPMPTRALDRVRLDLAGHFAAAKGRATGVVDQARARAVTASAYALVFAPVWVPLLIVLFIALHLLTRAVLIPLWFRRAEIALWLLSAARSLYALLPERVRKPVSRVRGAIRTPPPAAGAGD